MSLQGIPEILHVTDNHCAARHSAQWASIKFFRKDSIYSKSRAENISEAIQYRTLDRSC